MPEAMGFYTDTTLCIGCKGCEVACKNWNHLPAANGGGTQMSGACAKACPTDSIQFGPIGELRERARQRVDQLHAQGEKRAYLYGADPVGPLGGLNSFYLLVDQPQVYGLPTNPQLPSRNLKRSAVFSGASAVVLGLLALVGLRKQRMDEVGSGGSRRV